MKLRISKNAIDLIKDHEIIFLDASTNNLEIAKALNNVKKAQSLPIDGDCMKLKKILP